MGNICSVVEVYKSYMLSADWFCEEYNLKKPTLLGAEIEDPVTGEYSFTVLSYSFLHDSISTWASHYSSALQAKLLLKAMSQSQQFPWPELKQFKLANFQQDHARELGLPFSTAYLNSKWTPRLRTPRPVTEKEEDRKPRVVEWLGLGVVGSPFRA